MNEDNFWEFSDQMDEKKQPQLDNLKKENEERKTNNDETLNGMVFKTTTVINELISKIFEIINGTPK